MRIMVLASGDLWAGAEVMVYQLVSWLAGIEEVDLCVVLLNQEKLADELAKIGVEIHVVDETKHSFIVLARLVKRVVSEFAPDIIHSHRYKENLLAWLVGFGHPNIKLVATQHGMPEINDAGQNVTNRLRIVLFFRLLSCCFKRTVIVSEEMQRALVGLYGFSSKNLTVIHNGVGIPDSVIRTPQMRVIVGSAGRLFSVKDFSLLVDVADYVISQSKVIDFVLAGDGPERSLLEDKVRYYGIQDRFTFLGHVDDMDVLYRSLDVYINTSGHEGIPMSVLEAMSYGLPVVVPEVGGFPEIVENENSGFLVEGRDPSHFAGRILRLLQFDRRYSMGRAARQRVMDCFSREFMAQAYYQLYKDII